MLRSLLKPDSGLMITMTQITDCIFLSLFFLLGCIPVVSIGASLTALYDATYQGFRRGDKHCWQRFFYSFRRNLKASILPTLIILPGFAAVGKSLISIWNAAVAGERSWMVFSAAAMASMLFIGVFSLVFPMLSRFDNTTENLLKNSLMVGAANMPRTLALGMVNAGTVLVCAVYVVPVFFLPCLAALIGTLFIEPMFKPYMPEEE